MEKTGSKVNKRILEIRMLGDFSFCSNDRMLSGDKVRGKQIWSLLEYIMVNRHNEISMDGLIQALWRDDEIEDPANALKNLAYRLRVTLKNSLDLEDEVILYKHGAYVWNKNVPCIVDVDELEAVYKETQQKSLSKDELLTRYRKMINIYKGNFMPQSSFKEWIVPFNVYYQRIYMESVAACCEILLEREDFRSVEEICHRAIVIDPFVETNHANLLKALIGLKNHDKAVDHYNYVNKLFYDELGVRPSDLVTKLYHDATNKNTALNQDIALIKDNLKEVAKILGAVYCNYEQFKMIYQLEARAALRSGKSIFIALLTVTGKNKKELPRESLDVTFDKIKNAIVSSLRKDDVVTRYGRTQFLLLLSNLTYEDANTVLNRLVWKINESGFHNSIEVFGQFQSLDPIELEERDVSI
ncbi:BTAD domain-containing putative transcriptional regulator [Desulfitobacterium sp. PCE1]|uniref:BTAD domain-containing putative transcriptional regulator n=1 Tax=Desulfitobacterium sp. PCE1 TaxID=146907 RepID=UPI00036F185B|nr:BTAD domain-containing putative transcriptional regulator [Desulfitobacterium sp. PCE1]